MDLQKALNILDITDINFSYKTLKKAYFKKALIWHPDKNKSKEGSVYYREICDAYEFLNVNILDTYQQENDNDFLLNFINSTYGININSEQMKIIIDILKQGCQDIIIKMFKSLDKTTTNKMLDFLQQHYFLFGFKRGYIEKLSNIIRHKTNCIINIELTPSLDNLFNSDVYKLVLEHDEILYIPLWHDELEFKIDNSTVIVKIQPLIPSSIIIDDDNHIHFFKTLHIKELLGKECFELNIASKNFTIKINELSILPRQIIYFKHQGIAQVNLQSIFSNDNLSDVIVHIELIN